MDQDVDVAPRAAAAQRDRARLADALHAGLVQRVTALSLAVDDALLHHADGDPAAVERTLRSLRAHADAAIAECRTVIDGLRDRGGA